MKTIYDQLTEYKTSGYYGFHMPGHKRNEHMLEASLPFGIDITEIEGFDDLHHAQGLILRAQERAARLYHAQETHFLVNGSTCGILGAILGSTKRGDKILLGRNCHKSVYHALILNELVPVYVYPPTLASQELNGPIEPEEVARLLKTEKDVRAVVLVSPTYDGIVSDVEAIAEIVHRHEIPLIIDEAHGAHFGFHPYFPGNANQKGADIVIHSTHKTMPALTQTALLHINGKIADRQKVRDYLHMLQSSSPSYVLMASIDACMEWVEQEGLKAFAAYADRLTRLREELGDLCNLQILQAACMDPSKILISAGRTNRNGKELYGILLEEYHLQMEMCTESYVLAMTSPADTEEGFIRLKEALHLIDGQLERQNTKSTAPKKHIPLAETVYLPCHARGRCNAYLTYKESAGKIAGEYAYLYPPGIPIVVPGERISKEAAELLAFYEEMGFSIEGLKVDKRIGVWING